jgi:hypothetical protein
LPFYTSAGAENASLESFVQAPRKHQITDRQRGERQAASTFAFDRRFTIVEVGVIARVDYSGDPRSEFLG